jgi:hypothetical protein
MVGRVVGSLSNTAGSAGLSNNKALNSLDLFTAAISTPQNPPASARLLDSIQGGDISLVDFIVGNPLVESPLNWPVAENSPEFSLTGSSSAAGLAGASAAGPFYIPGKLPFYPSPSSRRSQSFSDGYPDVSHVAVNLPQWSQIFSGGDGSSANPFKISTVAQLQALAQLVNSLTNATAWIPNSPTLEPESNNNLYQKYLQFTEAEGASYVLQNDLDLAGINWVPIGSAAKPSPINFDGGKHVLHNLTIDRPSNPDLDLGSVETITKITAGLGLFGSSTGRISALGLDGVKITAPDYINVGAIAGLQSDNSIKNCYSHGEITAADNLGGLVGEFVPTSFDYHPRVEVGLSTVRLTPATESSSFGGLYDRTCVEL